jgi:hypothetical protein
MKQLSHAGWFVAEVHLTAAGEELGIEKASEAMFDRAGHV